MHDSKNVLNDQRPWVREINPTLLSMRQVINRPLNSKRFWDPGKGWFRYKSASSLAHHFKTKMSQYWLTGHPPSCFYVFCVFTHNYPFIRPIFPSVLWFYLIISTQPFPLIHKCLPSLFPLSPLASQMQTLSGISVKESLTFSKVPTCLHPFTTKMIRIEIFLLP